MKWAVTGKWFLAAGLAIGLSAAIHTTDAFADEAEDRAELIEAAKDHLEQMAKHLKDLAKAKGIRMVLSAATEATKLKKTLEDLEDVQGDDDEAKDLAKDWPADAQHFLKTMGALARMKKDQQKIDQLNVPGWCKETEKDLKEVIKVHAPKEGPKNPNSMQDLTAWGKKTGNKTKKKLSEAKRIVVKTIAAESQADHFKASGDWQEVTKAIKGAAEGMREIVEESMEKAKEACEDLLKGRRHPLIIAARKRIAESTGDAIADFQAAVDAWEKDAAGYFKLDCEAMKEIVVAFCDNLDGETDVRGGHSAAKAAGKKIQNKQKKDFEELEERLGELKEEAEESNPEFKDIIKETVVEARKLANLKDKGAVLGRYHPTIQYYIDYGIAQHKKKEVDNKCDVRDKSFGGVGRPDCVKADGCIILEFKPDSPSAIAKGRTQLNKYHPSVTGYYSARIYSPEKIKRELGGRQIMENFVKYGCVKGNKVIFKTKVDPYDRCESRDPCVR